MTAYKFSTPTTIWFGSGSLSKLAEEANRFRASSAVVFADKGVVDAGIVAKVTAVLDEANVSSVTWDRVSPEPSIGLAQEAVDFTRERFDKDGAGLVVGVGGGSSLDIAKVCAVMTANTGSVSDYLNLAGSRSVEKRGLPKVLIPTTSGTGSEVTNISVFSLETSKDVVVHEFLLAEAAIVDPDLTLTLPPRATAATGMDAFTHAIEAFTSINATPFTDLLALEAIRRVWRSLTVAVWNGRDLAARTDLSFASLLAGHAFYNAGVAAVHALAYPIGGRYHVAHGESNALMLPYVYEAIWPSCIHKLCEASKAMGVFRHKFNAREASLAFLQSIKDMIQDVGLPPRLRDYGVPEDAAELLAKDGIEQKRLLARSPKILSYDDIFSIYRRAW